jgi:hypothetical protein
MHTLWFHFKIFRFMLCCIHLAASSTANDKPLLSLELCVSTNKALNQLCTFRLHEQAFQVGSKYPAWRWLGSRELNPNNKL